MATPVFQAATNPVAAFGSFFLAWPTHIANDIGLLVVETAGDGSTFSITGWQTVPGSPVVDVASAAGSKLQVFYKRAASAFESNAFIPDSGDHQIARLYTFRNCIATGSPWDVTTTGIKTTASFTATVPAVTTTVANTLITMIVGRPDDSGSLSHFGVPFNPVLTSIQELGEAGSSIGNGGGFVVSTGIKESAGNTSTSALNKNFSTTDTYMVIAFKGEPPSNTISPIVRAFSLTGNAATLKQNVVFTANTGTFNFTGNAATLVKAAAIKLLLANAGTFALNGQPVTLRQNFKVEAVAGSFTLTGGAPALLRGRYLSGGSGAFVETGQPVVFLRTWVINAIADLFALTGNSTALTQINVYKIDPIAGNFTVNGQSAILLHNQNVDFVVGQFALNGNQTAFRHNYLASAIVGTFALTGEQSQLCHNYLLLANTGSFLENAEAVNLAYNQQLAVNTSVFAFNGNDAGLIAIQILVLNADTGSFVFTGNNVNLFKIRNVAVDVNRGSFAFNGNDTNFRRNKNVNAFAGQFIVSGNNINIARALFLNAATGSVAFSGLNVSPQKNNALMLLEGLASFVLTGKNITLTKAVARRRNVFIF